MGSRVKIRAQGSPWMVGVEIALVCGQAYGLVTFTEMEQGAYVEPALRIDMTDAQVLMDDLWAAGLRPTEGSGSAGAMKATQDHLQDMRAVAFKKLGVEKP